MEILRRIVEREHYCIARPIGRGVVWELLGGAIVQEHNVRAFDLLGHGAAPTVYA